MKRKFTRRQALCHGAGITGAFVAGVGLGSCASSATGAIDKSVYPWPYAKLDVARTGSLGYQGYRVGHCAYATFVAIAGQIADLYGEPFSSFPFDMWKYGHAGIAGWGTVCGTLNGAAAAMALFYPVEDHDPLVDALFAWYQKEHLPKYLPPQPVLDEEILATEAASPLCHLSVGTWIHAAGFDFSSPQRSERCARLAGDVAAKTAMLLNEKQNETFSFQGLDTQTQDCLACHGKDKMNDDIVSKMHCTTCHEED